MAVSSAQKMAVKKYREKMYDTIGFDVPKGKREEFKARAAAEGLSLAKFLFLAAESYKANHAATTAQQALQATLEPTRDTLTVDEKTALNNLNRLPVKVQKAVLKLIAEIGDSQPKGGD